ncbi:hypothetical protein F5Y17DRAFT_432540, partial [Xylariaceae sp. FL0594]
MAFCYPAQNEIRRLNTEIKPWIHALTGYIAILVLDFPVFAPLYQYFTAYRVASPKATAFWTWDTASAERSLLQRVSDLL